jgi:FkbM family methyltransferase
MWDDSNKLRMMHRCWSYRFKSEVPSIRLVRQANFAGRTLLDVGANKGVYSIYMSRAAGANGRVVSFEPQPELGEHLQTIREKFRLGNMTIANVGLSSQPGVLKLHRPKVGSGGASFHHKNLAGLQELDVAVTTLDQYALDSQLGPVHFIKCDVENHELEVFRGGEETLRRDLPILIFECNYEIAARGELFGYLCELGYDGYFFFVSQADHARYRFKGRGKYVHYSEFADYEFVRPGMQLRNYVFLKRGTRPESLTG